MPGVPRHATIIIPTHDHGLTLRYPLASLKRQTLAGFDAFVIGDGVPDALKPALHELVADDERFHFIDRPKHVRRGEPYRHEVLQTAADGIVCYLADRDIWLPDHLEQMWAFSSPPTTRTPSRCTFFRTAVAGRSRSISALPATGG